MDFENENNNPIDAEFIEDTYTKFINGKPIYYKTNEVAQALGENDSTIRFWCQMFADFLPIETSGRNRKFKDGDIEKLRFIQKLLRIDKLSIQQVKEYCSEPNIEKRLVKESDPLPVQIIATSTAIEVGSQLNDYLERMENNILDKIEQNHQLELDLIKEEFSKNQEENRKLKEDLSKAIELNSKGLSELQQLIDTKELEAKQRDEEKIALLKSNMEERKKASEQLEKEKSKGLFSKLFKK